MGLENDYMIRMIQRLAGAFFRILAGRTVEDPNAALLQVERLLADAFGGVPDMMLSQNPESIAMLEPAMATEVARLYALHAELSEEVGKSPRQAAVLAVAAFDRAFDPPHSKQTAVAEQTLATQFAMLADFVGPAEVAALCVKAFGICREENRFADADNWVFRALELAVNPTFVDEARRYFDDLAERSDEELRAGGLSLEEVAESRSDLGAYETMGS